jgi:HEAT repeat protein
VTRTIPELLQELSSADPEARRAACLAAPNNPSAIVLVDALTEALADSVKSVARAASEALVAIGSQQGGVEKALRAALRSSVPSQRWSAALTAARLEPPGTRLLPPLVEAMSSADGDVRWASARVIVEIGRLHGEVLPLLVAMVRSGESAVARRMASFALRELAPDRSEAAEVLLAATRDVDLHVRRAAFTALASLMSPSPEVTTRLIEALRGDDDAPTRRLAALALGEIGSANPEAISPDIMQALRQEHQQCRDPDLQRAIQRTLERLRNHASA